MIGWVLTRWRRRYQRPHRHVLDEVDSGENLTAVVRLVRAELSLMDAALAGDESLAQALGHEVVPGWATFTAALRPTRDALAEDPDGSRWGARFFLAGEPPELVGWGGFKGPPKDGTVELGYEIAESRRGRGLATGAALAMLDEAFADDSVTAVIAHTLPESNASSRVLEKAGFRFHGEAEENGRPVWRYSATRPAGSRPAPAPACRPAVPGRTASPRAGTPRR
jgi:[ribosomal protein S5]-alanine N-acetyltransferase